MILAESWLCNGFGVVVSLVVALCFLWVLFISFIGVKREEVIVIY